MIDQSTTKVKIHDLLLDVKLESSTSDGYSGDLFRSHREPKAPEVNQRPLLICDTECYHDYWSIGFLEPDSMQAICFELFPGQLLDVASITDIFKKYTVLTFNGLRYDLAMILAALNRCSNEQLKHLNDEIIGGDRFAGRRKAPAYFDIIDLMPLTKGGLKALGTRLHCKTLRETAFDWEEVFTEKHHPLTREYLKNDLKVTLSLYNELKPQIDLRIQLGKQYGLDLRSSSNAQCAEKVLVKRVKEICKTPIEAPIIPSVIQYTPPSSIQFKTKECQRILHAFEDNEFTILSNGKLSEFNGPEIELAGNTFWFGKGGIHSKEKSVCTRADDEYELIDRDLNAFYSSVMLRDQLYPELLGPDFLTIFREFYELKIAANKSGDKDTEETAKIILNGASGKLQQRFSKLYTPKRYLAMTITGQLTVLLLLERLAAANIQVLNANTDGVVSKVKRTERHIFDEVIEKFEADIEFSTKETEYLVYAARDVNCYIAIKKDGSLKTKGGPFVISGPGLPGAAGIGNNLNAKIIPLAIGAFLKDKTPIELTINGSSDIREFLFAAHVSSPCYYKGEIVGKDPRFFYGFEPTILENRGRIKKDGSYYKVPSSDYAVPLMDLDGTFSPELNRGYYINLANELLADIGAIPKIKQTKAKRSKT